MTKTNKTLLLILPIVFAVTACADAAEEFNDAPRSGNNDDPALTISFPDGYGNVARKCDGPNMVYSARVGDGGRGVSVVPNDPRCDSAPR